MSLFGSNVAFCYVNKATIEKCLKVEVLVDSRPYQVGLELSFLPPHLLGGERDCTKMLFTPGSQRMRAKKHIKS